jgi:hypothetical protein
MDINKSFDAAEHKAKIAELTAALADVKMALTDANAELQGQAAEIGRLIKDAARKAELEEVQGYQYEKNAQGNPEGWPFCPVCLEDYLRLYRLVKLENRPRGMCYCPKCKAEYSSRYIPAQPNT